MAPATAPTLPAPIAITVARQQKASNPGHSAWVSANAGSGKTTVLVARVIRLLLAGVKPDEILCLTFTKAAAANMANRVFSTLSAWVTLSDADLDQALERMGEAAPHAAGRARKRNLARKLFARAIETPGGLKVQTIHAFCERVLQLFPFEANVPSRFSVLDEAKAQALIDEAIAAMAAGEGQAGARLREAFERIARESSEDSFRTLLDEALRERAYFRENARDATQTDITRAALALTLGIRNGESEQSVIADYCAGGIWNGPCGEIAGLLQTGTKTDMERAAKLALLRTLADAERFAAARAFFLTKKGEAKAGSSLLTQALQTQRPDLAQALFDEQTRLLAAQEKLHAIRTLERTDALNRVAGAIIARYEAAKARLGALDFDDLIAKILTLFSRVDAAWVLYKLDMSVGHVLVDEAQDTSLAQWTILQKLTAEFAAGIGARPSDRTVFVVGDEKQSIYSFQGAAPEAFERERQATRALHAQTERPFESVTLDVSFRSAPEILTAVDRVFAEPAHFRGLGFDGEKGPAHESARENEPGFVELWPVEKKEPGEEVEDAWSAPVDAPEPDSPTVRLAARIARDIAALIAHGDPTGTPVSAGDVMILVRRRNALFEAIIAALKRQGLPVAGADRLVLSEHIAVKDLIALGRAMLLPEDDFSLACLLKSPLVGLDDDDLLRFAPARKGSLWRALRDAAAGGEAHLVEAHARIEGWHERSGHHGPFGFYAAVLEAGGGRRKLLARLGGEAADAIDEFLARAHRHERENAPSLATFLHDLIGDAGEIKRDLDQTGDVIRVMTVHAAKGLEAPIVYLPDTCTAPTARHDPQLFPLTAPVSKRPLIAWSPVRATDAPIVGRAREARQRAMADEYRRLLYVAMTRAERGLVICGAIGKDRPDEGSWYAMTESSLSQGGTVGRYEGTLAETPAREAVQPEIPVRAWQLAPPRVLKGRQAEEPRPDADRERVPAWLFLPATPEEPRPAPLKPSSALDAADRTGRPIDRPFAAAALARGRFVHRLVEHLPDCHPDRRETAARILARQHAGRLDAAEIESLIERTLVLIADPRLAPLLGPGSRAEVAVAGPVTLAGGIVFEVSGQIDRLAVTDEAVLIADYKTAARPPERAEDTAPSILAQMALYRALLAPLFPGKRIKSLLVWTAGPRLDPLDDALLDAALASLAGQHDPASHGTVKSGAS